MLHVDMLRDKKRDVDALVRDCGCYLAPGEYHATNVFGKMALRRGRLSLNPRSLYYQAIFGTYLIPNVPNGFDCTIALPSPFLNHKFFDEEKRRVYTRFSGKYWDNALRFADEMAPHLPTLVERAIPEHHMLVERFAKSVPLADQEQCFRAMAEELLAYLAQAPRHEALSAAQAKAELDAAALPADVQAYVEHIARHLPEDGAAFPTVVCHNDTHVLNVITEDNRAFYLVDFELCRKNVFFFDVMGFIFNSAVFRRDRALFERYRSGAFDDIMARAFSLFGMEFDASRRDSYACLFLLFKIRLVNQLEPALLPTYAWKIEEFLDIIEA